MLLVNLTRKQKLGKALNIMHTGYLYIISNKSWLKPNGTLIMKYFLGSGFDETMSKLDKNFKKINVFKPTSSKKKSNEVYLICIDFKD